MPLAANLPPSTAGRTASIAILGRVAARSAPGGAGRRIGFAGAKRYHEPRPGPFERTPGHDRPAGRLGVVKRNQVPPTPPIPGSTTSAASALPSSGFGFNARTSQARPAAARRPRPPPRAPRPAAQVAREEFGLLPPARVDGGDLGFEASLEPEGHHPERRVVSGKHERPQPLRSVAGRGPDGDFVSAIALAKRGDPRRVLVNPRRAKIPPAGRGGRGVEAALRESATAAGSAP